MRLRYKFLFTEEEFLSFTHKEGSHIIWDGPTNGTYGKYSIYLAHKWSYEQFVGPIPEGEFVLHKCDIPLCVNPKHLFTGTQVDNMQDAKRKGRLQRTDEWKRNLSLSLKGKKNFSKDRRKNISNGLKKYFARKRGEI